MNLDDGKVTLIAEDPRADVGGVLAHPTEKTIQAVSFTYVANEWKILDSGDQGRPRLSRRGVEDGEIIVTEPHARRQASGSSPSCSTTAR